MEHSNLTVLNPMSTTVRTATPGEALMAPAAAPTTALVIPAAADLGEPRQLSALDLHLLDTETEYAPTHIGGIMLVDSGNAPEGPVGIATLRRLFAERMHLMAPLRRRVCLVPLGLDLPYWEDCATIDLGYHVRDIRLPDGSGDEELAAYISRRHTEPLDRSRPLWEAHLLSGLADGRQAVYVKFHHALLDGVSGAETFGAILDAAPGARPEPLPDHGLRRDRTPSIPEMLARLVPNVFNRQVERVRAVVNSGPAMLRTLDELRSQFRTAPFNGPLTSARTVAFTSISLADVKTVKNQIGGTVNDVVMAVCTSALRQWLLESELPADHPVLAAIPVSVRSDGQRGTAGNQFSLMFGQLPITEPDPQLRLKLVQNSLLEAKERFRSQAPTLLHQITSLQTPLLHGATTRTLLRASAPVLPLTNLLVSNVPGPPESAYLAGARVLANYPLSALSDVFGSINITVVSYAGHIDVGIVACADLVPDAWAIARHLPPSLSELLH
ncbi:wax ester/triacylglycerol synthase family O-acyltransferase [Nocardia asteroides]|uniref:wax ester/triacylglycerol synthase family O-acyltransferase n=1 Tax=Nocardia asteroides TaxID=1824 RepID=UPI0037CC3D97